MKCSKGSRIQAGAENCGVRGRHAVPDSARVVDICLTLQMRESAARFRAALVRSLELSAAYLTPATSVEPCTSMNTGLL